jgi:GAF domain-containing protein
MRAQDPGDRFAAIARELLAQPSTEATADRISEMAVEVIRGCDHAGISLVEHRKIRTIAATDGVVAEGDRRQYALDEGPCLDTIRDHETIRAPRLATEDRWPRWAPSVSSELGVQSMLCFQLFTSDHSYGGINLYSDRPMAFDAHDEAVGLALAAHAAVALAASQTITTLNNAVGSRTAIGQAEGILMERFGLTADQAFSVLVRVSQNDNRRLALVAEELVKTRRIPGLPTDSGTDQP